MTLSTLLRDARCPDARGGRNRIEKKFLRNKQ